MRACVSIFLCLNGQAYNCFIHHYKRDSYDLMHHELGRYEIGRHEIWRLEILCLRIWRHEMWCHDLWHHDIRCHKIWRHKIWYNEIWRHENEETLGLKTVPGPSLLNLSCACWIYIRHLLSWCHSQSSPLPDFLLWLSFRDPLLGCKITLKVAQFSLVTFSKIRWFSLNHHNSLSTDNNKFLHHRFFERPMFGASSDI